MTREEFRKLVLEKIVGVRDFINWCEEITKKKGFFTKRDVINQFIPKLRNFI